MIFFVKSWFFVKITIFFLLQPHLWIPMPHPRNGTPTKCWWTLQSIEVCVVNFSWKRKSFSWKWRIFRESDEIFVKSLKKHSVEIYGFFCHSEFFRETDLSEWFQKKAWNISWNWFTLKEDFLRKNQLFPSNQRDFT